MSKLSLLLLSLFAVAGCAASETDAASSDDALTSSSTSAPALSAIVGTWSDYGVAVEDPAGHEKQIIMGLTLESSHRFKATLTSVCDDDGRGLCGEPASGTFTYTSGRLELTFSTGPSTPFVYSSVTLTSGGVLEFYRDSQFSGGRPYVANRLVAAIIRTTCGGCQDVYTSCLEGGSASSCRPKFNQCTFDSTFKSFELAQADCYPREATDEVCKRAQSWAKDNDHDAESMKYSKEILSFYGISQAACPLR
jgi:hypothetical protein